MVHVFKMEITHVVLVFKLAASNFDAAKQISSMNKSSERYKQLNTHPQYQKRIREVYNLRQLTNL